MCSSFVNEGDVVNDGDELDSDIVSICDVRMGRDLINGAGAVFGAFFDRIFIPYDS